MQRNCIVSNQRSIKFVETEFENPLIAQIIKNLRKL